MATLSFLLLLAIVTCSKAKLGYLKETNIVSYMHDIESGTNITTIPVAGTTNKLFSVLRFGTIAAIDDLLTKGYNRNSTQVGKAHGIYVNSVVDGSDLHLLMSLVFTNKPFISSTLKVQGSDMFFLKYQEVSVISRTGKFKMGRGYAIMETVYLDLVGLNTIVKWNLTVFHN